MTSIRKPGSLNCVCDRGRGGSESPFLDIFFRSKTQSHSFCDVIFYIPVDVTDCSPRSGHHAVSADPCFLSSFQRNRSANSFFIRFEVRFFTIIQPPCKNVGLWEQSLPARSYQKYFWNIRLRKRPNICETGHFHRRNEILLYKPLL